MPHHNATVGFGTAALGAECFQVVQMALDAGFRRFDTAEADWWYDQAAVGRALQASNACDVLISTKIPPWSLTSDENIRASAASSRNELVGFCGDELALDVYYIHAPTCWKGWHPRCEDHAPLLDLRSSWMAMEAVVGLDHNAARIGLSNVHPDELLNIIEFVGDRIEDGELNPPPRIPDVVQAFADPIQPAEQLREICREYGIEFVSYSTLGTQHRNVPSNPVLGSPIIQSIANKHGRSTAEVVLSWALSQGMSVIPRSRQKQHIKELARLLYDPTPFLDAHDLLQIDQMKYTL